MEKVNGKWIAQSILIVKKIEKKTMNGWRRR